MSDAKVTIHVQAGDETKEWAPKMARFVWKSLDRWYRLHPDLAIQVATFDGFYLEHPQPRQVYDQLSDVCKD